MNALGRYAEKIEVTDGCWTWLGTRTTRGYGRIFKGRKPYQAHRVVYELLVGAIPEGMTLDHLCRNRLCVNPAHLEPVSDRINRMRGISPPAVAARRATCVHGHEYTPQTMRLTKQGARVCRICTNEKARARLQNDPEQRARRNAKDRRLYWEKKAEA